MNELVVVKHNRVIEAAYKLTLAEQRVLLSVIAKIDSTIQIPLDAEFCITASEIRDLFDLDSSQSYRELKKSIDRLYERTVAIKGEDEHLRWLSWKKYDKGNGRVFIQFSQKIIPYLSQLKGNFTQYKLNSIKEFKTEYGVRLFELLTQWSSKGEREVDIDWLRTIFCIEDYYRSISDLKLKVIKPAVDDINKYSPLWVEYGQRKTGRTVTHLQFKFGLKAENQPADKHTKRITDDQIKAAARPGETTVQVVKRLRTQTKIPKQAETTEQAQARKKAIEEINKTVGRHPKKPSS